MLAVDESYRKHGIGKLFSEHLLLITWPILSFIEEYVLGSNLVLKAIRVMAAEGADEVGHSLQNNNFQ